MVFEERTYTIKPGKVPTLLAIYEREGLPLQRRHLGEPVGWFTSEFGALNQVVHIWRFETLEDRTKRRAGLLADPAWLAFVPKALELIEKQENRILVPTSFSPLR